MDSNDNTTSASSASNIFHLYQEGHGHDQVLQLCFLRRRTPRHFRLDRTRIEDEFILPRPELKIASLLPPVHISLNQLIMFDSSSSSSIHSVTEHREINFALDQVRESAKRHFFNPRQVALEDVARWAALTESDWLSIYQSIQQSMQQPGQDEEMTDLSAARVPDIIDICWLLEHCQSDAFASFVWNHLLLVILQTCMASDSLMHQVLTLLVSHRSLASLSPKDFRAKVRSRNLRQAGDFIGAKAELALVGIYRRQRDRDIK
ncbi:unnamed protein product [Peronospora belbahrii]|nr:unnamed protein product [Peronospora belbahrii]